MSDAQVIEIPQDVFDSARLTKDQMRIELALSLYNQRRLSIGKRGNWPVCLFGNFGNTLVNGAFRHTTISRI